MPDALHPKELVLVGGGHAHLAVLQALRRQAWPAVSVTLVTPEPTLCYSGMVPGWLAGHHRSEALHIPLAPLARAAGVRWRQDRVSAVDAARRTVQLASGEALAYDVLSLACGAVVDGEALHGFSGPLLPTRPLEALLAGWPPLKAHLAAHGGHLVVLGGGAAGVELALAARHVLRDARRVPISLVIGAGLLPGHATAGRALVRRACEQAGITLREGRVNQAAGPTLHLDDGTIEADAVVVATGPRPPAWLAHSGLALCPKGFVGTGPTLQSVSHPEVFAAGDVASRLDGPHPKSGVYAVRSGPWLAENLRRVLAGQPLRAFRPQAISLALLGSGPGQAIALWGPLAASGGWVWRWKNWLDQRFVRHHGALSG